MSAKLVKKEPIRWVFPEDLERPEGIPDPTMKQALENVKKLEKLNGRKDHND